MNHDRTPEKDGLRLVGKAPVADFGPERTSRERLLPDEKTLEKVAHYEAHLPRLFHKALHELEALQTRRSGGVLPLARLEVQVSED